MKAIKINLSLLVSVFFSLTVMAQTNTKATDNIIGKKLFMDVHHLGQGNVSAGAVAAAHQKDLNTQLKYGVQFIKYWVDSVRGNIFCLSSAANSSSITNTHAEAHGLIPDEVFTVTEGMEATMRGGKNLYLDIHELGPGNVSDADVASAHQKDLGVQKKHGVNFINYWADIKKGFVFCLSEANDSLDVIQTHRDAHGLLPSYLLRVEEGQ